VAQAANREPEILGQPDMSLPLLLGVCAPGAALMKLLRALGQREQNLEVVRRQGLEVSRPASFGGCLSVTDKFVLVGRD
jgi:hypothetical protein